MTNPIHTLRDALGEAKHHAKTRPVFNALLRAESALREMEAEPRYTVGQFFDALDAELELDKLDPLLQAYKDAIKRRLAEMVER